MKKRRGKNINIKMNLTNKWIYTLIAIGILIIIGVGIYAYGTSNPPIFGHSAGEIEEADPTVISSVKDGVSWSEVTSKPAGFADDIDNVGASTLTCVTRATSAGSTCDNICAGSGERCTSVRYSANAIDCNFDQPSGYTYYCRCCKIS